MRRGAVTMGITAGLWTLMPFASAEPARLAPSGRAAAPASAEALTEAQKAELDRCVGRALRWIASRQRSDGSFPTLPIGQPAVTALCVMAFMSAGHLPGEGPYGQALDRGLKYILDSQKPDGLIARVLPGNGGDIMTLRTTAAVAYNHAISGLCLSELYGMAADRNAKMRPVLQSALVYALQHQPAPKRNPNDNGGWRYSRPYQSSDSDLSVTSWYLMFLRSCRNSGFEVPSQTIDEGTAYVMRLYDQPTGRFWYALRGQEHVTTRGMTGAGILSLSLAGRHQTPAALKAGEWLLNHPYGLYREKAGPHDRFFYGAFYSSQAMFQLGGHYWSEFYPVLLRTLVENQRSGGGWDSETGSDEMFGDVYSSAMAVLALSPPYQLLPVFQR